VLRKRDWANVRSLAEERRFTDETDEIKKALKGAHAHNPEPVETFFRKFKFADPKHLKDARFFITKLKGSQLKETLNRYLDYAHRFGVFMVRSREHDKFRVFTVLPGGEKFHVRIVENKFKPVSVPKLVPLAEEFEATELPVPKALQEEIDDGNARFVQIEDNEYSSLLSELEEFAYNPGRVTFILHKGTQPFLFWLFGERIDQTAARKLLTALNALQDELDLGPRVGRPPDRAREKKRKAASKKATTKEQVADFVERDTRDRLAPASAEEQDSAARHARRKRVQDGESQH
jgi:hypothetical protein